MQPEIPRLKTFLYGACITLGVFAVLEILLIFFTWLFSIHYPLVILLMTVSAFLVAGGLIGAGGIINIPVGHKAVPKVMDKRRTDFFVYRGLFSEGYNWVLPPPLMGAETIDVREKQTQIESFSALDKEGIKITTSVSIQWKVNSPFKSLDVTEGVIENSLKKLIESCLRTSIRKFSTEDLLGAYEETSTQVKNDLSTTAKGNANMWGIKILDVIVSDIEPPAEITKSYERIKVEKLQRTEEEIEQEHVRNLIKKARAKVVGLSPNEAKRLVQVERGKVKQNIEERTFGISQETAETIKIILEGIIKKP